MTAEREIEQQVLDYLKQTSELWGRAERTEATSTWAYRSVEAFLLEHGQFYAPQTLPAKYRRFYAPVKYCYDNAYRMAKKYKLRYVEGVATGIIVAGHAWCLDAEGRVLDPTWHDRNDNPEDRAYFGVVLPLQVVTRARRKTGASALHDWEHDFPLLQKPFVS